MHATTRTTYGIIFACLATLLFAFQDATTKQLLTNHSVWFILMVRYWTHFIVACCWSQIATGTISTALKSKSIPLQLLRGLFLLSEIALITMAFSMLGLADVTSILMAYPLLVTALAVVLLKESIGWRRILALLMGMLGLLVILQPTGNVWGLGGLLALGASLSFATYQILTRMVSRHDSPLTSYFYVGAFGLIVTTIVGLQHLPNWGDVDILLLAAVCLLSAAAHYSIVKALSLAEAIVIQPFNYLQLVWSIPIGLIVFGDIPLWTTLVGALMVVSAGLFSLSRAKSKAIKD
ncbi:DMT family transporter [Polycladidibacter stylochi]|uniref:DMT family transporter n=1 Tax=Polycladidibacter stylochi TaxID=1807766 RepID=UPI0008358EDA|nr:DMT family transporter [Pseudovibrio stylochi]